MGGADFKEVPGFLKSNRISFAYVLTSNKDQTFINKSCFVFLLYRGICRPGLEEFVNLQGLLVQSSKWFGISSVQFSSLGTSLPGKFVQLSSGYQGQVPPFSSFSSVHSVQFTNSSGPDSD